MGNSSANPQAIWTVDVSIELRPLSTQARNAFWDDFILEIEANDVLFGGAEHGFIEAGSADSADAARSALSDWLSSRQEPATFLLGQVERAETAR